MVDLGFHKVATLLLVHDDAQVLGSMCRMLRAWNVELKTVSSGEEALDWFAAGGQAHVVVADHEMRGLDGLTLFQRLSKASPDSTFILYTATVDLQLSLLPGTALTVLTKPTTTDLFLRCVSAALVSQLTLA